MKVKSTYFQSEITNSPLEAPNRCFVLFCSAMHLVEFYTQLLLTQYARCGRATHQTGPYRHCIHMTFSWSNSHNNTGTSVPCTWHGV